MFKIFIIVTLCVLSLTTFGQIIIKNNEFALKPLSVIVIDTIPKITNENDVLDILSGCIGCGPYLRNEIGFEVIASTTKPNFGLHIDFFPLVSQKLIFSTGFRFDCDKDYIFDAGIKSTGLISIRKTYVDFQLFYEKFVLHDLVSNNFNKATIGPVLSIKCTSIGLFLGEDFFNRNFSIEGYFAYKFHKKNQGIPINVFFSRQRIPYYQFAEISGKIGYMGNEVNYDMKLDCSLFNKINCGIGYRKIYEFNEAYFTVRYLLMIN